MKFNLAQMAARKRKSRKPITFNAIITTKAQADDLAAIYRRMLAPWADAAEILGDLYGNELARLGDSALITDSAADLGATTDAIAAAINRLVLELTPLLQRWAFSVEQWHRGKWVRAVLSGTEIDLETLLGPEDARETVDAWLVRNVSLVRDVNSQARGRIADAVLRGYQKRSPISEVTKEIREAANMARARARRIAAHQTVSLASALDDERRRQAGLDVWKWRHSAKLHPRPEHLARDGNLYSDDKGMRGKLKSGQIVLTPPEDRPGQLPNCGCVAQACLIFEGEVL